MQRKAKPTLSVRPSWYSDLQTLNTDRPRYINIVQQLGKLRVTPSKWNSSLGKNPD